MQEVLEFLCGRAFYIATVDGDAPRVRPFGFAMIYEGRLCFCTNNTKQVYRQLKTNPKFEICTMDEQRNWIRVRGKAEFITSKASKRAALEASPNLRRLYSEDDSIFEIFALTDGEAEFCSMASGTHYVKL